MKRVYILLNISILSIAALFSSCEKQGKEEVCEMKYTGRRPGGVVIELRDSQDRDLLDPATPGHYDTTEIKKLNTVGSGVQVMNKNDKNYTHLGNTDRIKLLMYFKDVAGSLSLKLSSTVTDEMTATFTYPIIDCGTVETITSFTYNSVAYTPRNKQYNCFVIKK